MHPIASILVDVKAGSVNSQTADPQVDALGALVDVPGLQRVSVNRYDNNVVAVAGANKAYLLPDSRSVTISDT